LNFVLFAPCEKYIHILIQAELLGVGMLIIFFKTAWRNIVRGKVYSLLNLFGLATGMAVAFLIGLWVHYQLSYDRWTPTE